MAYAIELTEAESEVLSGIELDALQVDCMQYQRQAPLVLRLYESLKDRNAIPEVRQRYWADPEYRIGSGNQSHKGIFEKNGRRGVEIYTHPHFLQYLRYFLFGAQLPDPVIKEFEEIVGNPQWVTSGDVANITSGARRVARKYGLQTEAEEFYRLALDIGLSQSYARAVRDAVMKAK